MLFDVCFSFFEPGGPPGLFFSAGFNMEDLEGRICSFWLVAFCVVENLSIVLLKRLDLVRSKHLIVGGKPVGSCSQLIKKTRFLSSVRVPEVFFLLAFDILAMGQKTVPQNSYR